MSRIQYIALLVLLLLGAAACKRQAPDLVYENYDFTADEPKGIDREKVTLPPADLHNQYIYFKDNDQKRDVLIQVEGDTEKLIAPEAVKVVISTSFPAKEAFTAELAVMSKEQYPKSHTQVFMEGAKELPPAAYSLGATKLDFAAGDHLKEVTITFNEAELQKLSTEEEYVLPLVVNLPDDKGIAKHNYFRLIVTLTKLDKLVEMENVTLVNNFPTDFVMVPHEHVSASADVASGHAYKVADGKTDQNWWVRSGTSGKLELSFPKTEVKGIMITSLNRKYLAGFSLFVSNNGGADTVSWGTVKESRPYNKMLIKFETPQLIDFIRLTDFFGSTDFIDIAEVTLFK